MPITLGIVAFSASKINKSIFTPKLVLVILLYLCFAIALPIAEYSNAHFQVVWRSGISGYNLEQVYGDWALKAALNTFIFGIVFAAQVILIGVIFTFKDVPNEEIVNIEE
jgi:hypothetical protein